MIEITRDEWSDKSVRMILTPSNYAQKSLFYIQEIGFFEATLNYYVQRKNLSSFLILQTLEGNGILNYNGKEYSLSRGDVFFIDCRKEHFYYIVGSKMLKKTSRGTVNAFSNFRLFSCLGRK